MRFDRRALLHGLPAWALASAMPGQRTLVAATPPVTEDSAGAPTLQALIDRGASAGSAIVVPPGPPLAVTGPVRVPDNATLVVRRDLIGGGEAALLLGGRTQVHFERCNVSDVTIRLLSGSVAVFGLNYSGKKQLAAVSIAGPGPYHNIRIENFTISNANFGILRQGANSTLNDAAIVNGVFRDMVGDAVEWNVCPHDRGVVIENHDILGIDAPAGKPNWGIGIGVAGARYTADWDPAYAAQDFIIRDITGRGLSQLVHVESAIDFSIERIIGDDISPKYSHESGLEYGSVVCYGCRKMTIADVRADARMLILSGVIAGHYIVPCADLLIQDVDLRRGDLRIDVGGAMSYAHLNRIRLDAGTLAVRGTAKDLAMTDVAVTSDSQADQPFTSDATFLSGSLAAFRPEAPTVRRSNVRLSHGT